MVFQQPAAICANRFRKYAGKCLWEELQVWLCLQTVMLVIGPVCKVRNHQPKWKDSNRSRAGTERVRGCRLFRGGGEEEAVSARELGDFESLLSRDASQNISVVKQRWAIFK